MALDLRILVIDSQANMTGILVGLLRHIGFNQVFIAHEISSGWSIYANRGPDLVICEESLPDGPGLALCKRIRMIEERERRLAMRSNPNKDRFMLTFSEEDAEPDIASKFMLVTAHPTRRLIQKAQSIGVDAVLAKPISPRDLEVRICQLLGVSNPRRASHQFA